MNGMGMDVGTIVRDLVRGLHGGLSSEAAAGVKKPAEFYRYGSPTKALYLAFDIRASFYPEKQEDKYKNAEASCSLHYLFHRPYGSEGFATTNTFASVQDSPFAKLDEIKSWEFLSSHDSCWADAARDKAWKVEREIVEIIAARAGFPGDDYPPHNRLSWHVWFPMFNRSFYSWVDVKIDKDPNDKHNYDKLIVVNNGVKNVQAKGSAA